MKQKVFLLVGSLRAGGSERVFWLLSQYLDKQKFDVSLVVVDMSNRFFSDKLDGVKVVDLKAGRFYKSVFKLYSLIKKERPHAIYCTGAHFTLALSLFSIFIKTPIKISREANVIDLMLPFEGLKERIINRFLKIAYRRMDFAICQSAEIKTLLNNRYKIPENKLVVIPNPVISCNGRRQNEGFSTKKRLITVARLSAEKGLFRLLKILKELPSAYTLTLVGDGPLRAQLESEICRLNLTDRVKLVGQISNVTQLVSEHDVLLITSYTEGFPNVALEALSVGVPVVSFRVGGILQIVKRKFNGYVLEQNDNQGFIESVIKASTQNWNTHAIIQDVNSRFGINKIIARYESLIS